MRPYYFLLLALTLVFACNNVAMANNVAHDHSVDNGAIKKNNLRRLRTEETTVAKDDDDDLSDEERVFGLGRAVSWFRFWKLRRAADKLKTTDVISAKESKWIDSWVKKDLSPTHVFKQLGLAKRGDKAMESQNYRLFETYTERMFAKDQGLYTKWLNTMMTPEDVYKALKLDKMKPSKASKTENFRRYEVYLFKWHEG